MLKNDTFNIFSLAEKNNFKRFVRFKIGLRDKIKYDIELIDGYINIFDNSEKKTHVVYACQTKYIKEQRIPPRFNSDWLTFTPGKDTYDYEVSTIDILVECSNKNYKKACEDLATNQGKNMEKLLYLTLEYFAYKYNLAVSGNDFIEVCDLCVGGFECFSYYRNKKSGKYELGKLIISPSMSIMKAREEENLTFQNIINTEIPAWKYFLNKTKYLYYTHNNLDCIINAAITMESYIIFLIKSNNKYNEYLEEKKNNLNFRSALIFAMDKGIINNEIETDFEKGYNKIRLQRTLIIHGTIDTPIVEREKAKIAYETIVDLFIGIEEKYSIDNKLQSINAYFEDDFKQMNCIIKKYEDGDYEAAINDLNLNINNNIFKDLSIFTRAKCYIKIKDSLKAIEDLRMCISNKYRLIQSYNMLGMELARINKHNEAKEEYLNGIKLDSQYPEYYYNLGISQQFLKEYDEAIISYKKALEIRQESPYYYNLGTVYYYKKDYNNTLLNYNNALKIQPNNCKYLYERSFLYETLKDPEKAEKDIIQCFKLYTGDPNIFCIKERIYQIGVLYQNKEMYKDAIRIFSYGIKIDNKSHAFFQARGNCYRSIEKTKEAEEDYKKCLRMETSSYKDLINIVYLYLDNYNFSEVNKYIKILINKYSMITEVKDCIDLYYFKSYQRGKKSYEELLEALNNNHSDIKESELYKRFKSDFGEKQTNEFFRIKN